MIVLHAYILAITISSTFMLSTFSFSVVDYFKVGYWLFQSAICWPWFSCSHVSHFVGDVQQNMHLVGSLF